MTIGLGHMTTGRDAWSRAYGLTFGVATLFLLLSLLSVASGVTSVWLNATIAGVFFIGSAISAVMLLRAAEGPVAVALFVLGAGLTFGFGTIYGVIVPGDSTSRLLFSRQVQEAYLGKINLVNAVAVICVLGAAWPLVRRGSSGASSGGVLQAVSDLRRVQGPLILGSLAIVCLILATYPVPQNLILRGLVSTLSKLPLVLLVVVAAQWSSQSLLARAVMLALLGILVGLSVLSTSKLGVLIPLAAVAGGFWINPSTRRVAVVLVLLSTVGYFWVLGPLSSSVRGLRTYNGGAAGLSASIGNVSSGAQALQDGNRRTTTSLLQRFSAAPYQAYLIGQYEQGLPGSSLRDLWAAAVPRVLWPDKPSMTRFGGQLYAQINRTTTATSQIAPTFSAEAFWNSGWVGLIFVSVLVGLQMGWFTRKWLDLASGKSAGLGILVFAIPVAFMSFLVETWVAATFVGGFLTIFLLINGVDFASRYLIGARARRGQQRPPAPA